MSELIIPLEVVQRWLEKSEEERTDFLNDPLTTDHLRRTISIIEGYCIAHRYRIYCDTQLFPSPDMFRRWEKHRNSRFTLHNHSFLVAPSRCVGLAAGGRYLNIKELFVSHCEAIESISSVVSSVSEYLCRRRKNNARSITNISAKLISLLLEACVASYYRQKIAQRREDVDHTVHPTPEKRAAPSGLHDEATTYRGLNVSKLLAVSLLLLRSSKKRSREDCDSDNSLTLIRNSVGGERKISLEKNIPLPFTISRVDVLAAVQLTR